MTYHETIDYLFNLQKFGMKFGLDNIRRLLSLLGNPQRAFRSVHIAGTNGKGSTAAMIEAMLRTSGTTTGLFTSPHLVSFTERITVSGEEITEARVVELAGKIRDVVLQVEDFSPTFFEVVTAMGFLHFQESGVAWAVVETGMGGRLDATNTLRPEISVITPIALDHAEFLGNTLRDISREKAGIIKPGIPVVLGPQEEAARDVLLARAADLHCPCSLYDRDFSAGKRAEACFDYRGSRDYPELRITLSGDHQLANAAVAVQAIEVLAARQSGLRCDVRKGLASVAWPGRIEMVSSDPLIMIDGAHNPAAAETLAAYLAGHAASYRRIIMVLGVMADKDVRGVLAPLLPHAAEVIFTAAAYGRAASPQHLAEEAAALGFSRAQTSRSVADAVRRAEEAASAGDLIVITGSFYTIGEAKEALGQKGTLARLRE